MVISTKNKNIAVRNILSETMRQGGKSYPALRIVINGGITEDELNELCSGALEIFDENGNVVGIHNDYTTRGELSFSIGRITTAEQERDTFKAALDAEYAKLPFIETLTANLDDATASTVIPLYPAMKYTGELIAAGTRINWNGTLKRAAIDLWDRIDCNPDNATDLWEDINYKDGYRIIPSPITAGLAFISGEKGWWTDGLLYESIVDNNVYTPEEYAANWKVVAA